MAVEKTFEIMAVEKTFEIVVNEKTYISKKMNPPRRGLITKKIIGSMGNADKESSEMINGMGNLFSENIPEVMWAFVKDDDKKDIGKYDTFIDGIDDECSLKFLKWCIDKVNEMNSFLGQSQGEAKV